MNFLYYETEKKNYGLTDQDIANAAGVSRSTLARWLNDPEHKHDDEIESALHAARDLKD